MSLYQPSLDDMVIEHPCTVEEARELTDRIKASVEQTWALLLEAHERRAWSALGYARWEDYVRGEFDKARQWSYQLLDQGRVNRAIAEASGVRHGVHEVSEREARDLKPHLPRLVEDVRERVQHVEPERVPDVVRQVVTETRERVREEWKQAREEQRELMNRINPPDFDPVENGDQVRQRGEFRRLCRDLSALPSPAEFLARHDGSMGYGALDEGHVEPARAAHAWLADFLERWDSQ